MIRDFVHRYLDPSETLAELLFGLIMALTLTLGARLLSQNAELQPVELAVALIGCNIAWGVIDAVLYLLGSIFSRNQRIHLVRKLRAVRSDAEAIATIREEFDLEDEPALSDEDRAAFHRVVTDILLHAAPERARLRSRDYVAALLVVLLVSATALPGVLPFLLISDGYLALRAANLVQTCLLFWVGFRWARYTGANPWWTGSMIALLSLGLVGVSLALGG